ncbi:MAG TPA: M13-type metalloendopeptidase [Acidimicrobiales bacterium]|nr:M13-type metalloendopeptidase [Acidimicrobiales bacterium]
MDSAPQKSGIDLDELSDQIRPQDDLFRHVNQQWFGSHAIPEDKSRYGSFTILDEASEAAIHEIVEEARTAEPGSEARKFGDLYASFMDEDRIEERGAEPLRERLARVAAVESAAQLLATIGELQRRGTDGIYQVFVDNDPGDPSRYLVFFEQGGISLPDESYYREEHFASVRAAFGEHLAKMFELAGLDDAAVRASRVVDLETHVASHHWDNVESRDSVKTYNLVAWPAAAELFAEGRGHPGDPAPGLDDWVGGLDAPPAALDEIVLRQPSFTSGVAELVNDQHLDAWKDWLSYRIIAGDAPFLSTPFVEESFDFYGRTLTGTPKLRERWKRGVGLVGGLMGEAVGRVYVERHFPPAAKQRMDALVAHLVEAYRQSITNLEWMSAPTRQRALEKLDAFTPKIGYPVKWRDYSTLVIDPSDVIANVRAGSEFEFRRQLAKIGAPVDRDEWFMTPQMINAYYNPGFNEIVFPAAILQPPFFDVARDDAANFGGIGSVIGHEIGHGFDDQGSRFDGTGRLADWWDAADRSAFEERTRSLIDQYNALAPLEVPNQHVNGALTIGENIGDLGGVGIAWKAYLISLDGAEPPVIDGLSAAQRFFMSYAQVWRVQYRPAETERLLAIDPHSPPEFRVNQIVRNVDEFYDAFGVGPDDSLWLEPAERVSIW